MHIIEGGQFLLICALAASLLQFFCLFLPRYCPPATFTLFTRSIFVALCLSFSALIYAYIISDFSVENVAQNSVSNLPLFYKITATWGNHEGSLLMWILGMSFCGLIFTLQQKSMSSKLYTTTLAAQSALIAKFLSLLIFTSNPFKRVFPFPVDGWDLNPLLQDPGLSYHPPSLYLGYVAYTLVFSLGISAIISQDKNWAQTMRGWALAAWGILTLGITAGSWWAYYVLGWGGWWFWDPVENISLFPWILGLMLIHALPITLQTKRFPRWTLTLSILIFSLALVGIFLVRSGLLTSVHMFAIDASRGIALLVLISLIFIPAYSLLAFRTRHLTPTAPLKSIITKEGSLLLNHLLFGIACITLFVGTLYPLLLEVFTGQAIHVGGAYYKSIYIFLLPLLAIGMAIGPLLKWQIPSWSIAYQSLVKLGVSFVLLLIVLGLFMFFFPMDFLPGRTFFGKLFSVISIGTGLFITLGIIWQAKAFFLKARTFLPSRSRLISMLVSHLGCAIFLFSVGIDGLYQEEKLWRIKITESIDYKGLNFHLQDIYVLPGQNFIANRAKIVIKKGEQEVRAVYPERHFYYIRDHVLPKSVIYTTGIMNWFITLGGRHEDDSWTLRIHFNPMTPWLWGGGLIMALGGFVGLYTQKQKRKERTI